jgi:HrpA-like RNA helicase
VIVAMLSVENIYASGTSSRTEAEARRRHFAHAFGDHLTLLEVWRAYDSVRTGIATHSGGLDSWCRNNSVNERSMKKVSDVVRQLRLLCNRKNIPLQSCGDNLDEVRKCLTSGLFLNCAVRGDGAYVTLMDHQPVNIHPSSVLKQTSKKPSHLIFSEVRRVRKRSVTFLFKICTVSYERMSVASCSLC